MQLDITGHALNLADGRVEVLACGEDFQLDQFIGWLNKGPEYANVMDVHVEHISQTMTNGFTTG